jgi:hypothetical protein
LRRFLRREGIGITIDLIAAPLTFWMLYSWLKVGLFCTVLFSIPGTFLVGRMFVLPALGIPFAIGVSMFYRRPCPACGQRGLLAGIRTSVPTADPRLHRQFQATRCTRCKRDLCLYGDGTWEYAPEDFLPPAPESGG